MPQRFAVVTGTSRGLGEAVAVELLERGWDVLGCARGEAPDALAGRSGYRHARVDLSDTDAVDRWAAGLLDGREPDEVALVNNAGTLAPIGALSDAGAADVTAALTVNVAAPLALMGAVIARAPREARVRVVNVSSGAASRPIPGWPTYCASKAALAMASAVQGAELDAMPRHAGRDVAVCSFSPNVVATDMQATIREQSADDFPDVERFVSLHDEGRLLSPEQPASALVDWIETARRGGHAEVDYAP